MTEAIDPAGTERQLPLTERLAISVEEAGMLLGISRDLAYDLVSRNELPSVRLGRRVVVPRRALEDMLRRMTDAADLDPEDRHWNQSRR